MSRPQAGVTGVVLRFRLRFLRSSVVNPLSPSDSATYPPSVTPRGAGVRGRGKVRIRPMYSGYIVSAPPSRG
jgi:hypothetical protein